MRGRKPKNRQHYVSDKKPIKKESPNEGTETRSYKKYMCCMPVYIKKESPNEGTETVRTLNDESHYKAYEIKKESPNEGTETQSGY